MKTKLKPEVWVDFLEGELDPKFKRNLEELLSKDMKELKYVIELKNLRHRLKNLPPTLILKPIPSEPNPEFWVGLKRGIMEKVRTAEMEPLPLQPEEIPPPPPAPIPGPQSR